MSPMLKKLLYSLLAAVLSFGALYLADSLLSLLTLKVILSLGVGVIVYFKVAMWEIQRVIDAGKGIASKLG